MTASPTPIGWRTVRSWRTGLRTGGPCGPRAPPAIDRGHAHRFRRQEKSAWHRAMGAGAPQVSGRQSRLPIWRQRLHYAPGCAAVQLLMFREQACRTSEAAKRVSAFPNSSMSRNLIERALRAANAPVWIILPVEIPPAVGAIAGVRIRLAWMKPEVEMRTHRIAVFHRLAAFGACLCRDAEPDAHARTACTATKVSGISNPCHARTERLSGPCYLP